MARMKAKGFANREIVETLGIPEDECISPNIDMMVRNLIEDEY